MHRAISAIRAAQLANAALTEQQVLAAAPTLQMENTKISTLKFSDHAKQRELFEACYQGKSIRARSLLLSGQVAADARYTPQKHATIGGLSFWGTGSTCLMFAANRSRVDVIQMLVEEFRAGVHQEDDYGCTALHCAAFFGHLPVVELLSEDFNADLAHRDFAGRTALMKAAERGKCKVVEYLLKHGANVNERDVNGKTALGIVGKLFGDHKIVNILQKHGASK